MNAFNFSVEQMDKKNDQLWLLTVRWEWFRGGLGLCYSLIIPFTFPFSLFCFQ